MIGTQIGLYEIIEKIGEGGYSTVYRARHVELGSEHALKILRSDLVSDEGLRTRFLQEGRILAGLEHPGIIRVTDTLSEPGMAGLVMQLVSGETLRDRLDRSGRVGAEEAIRWVSEALDALQHAHRNGIIHRDIKPSNLALETDAAGHVRCKLLDFGIAKVVGHAHTATDATMGTAGYMSPEQIQRPKDVDARTDVFSLGAVLYELVSGRAAFEGETPYQTMHQIASGDHPRLETLNLDLPPSLSAVVEQAMSVHADDRFADARAFSLALDRVYDPPASGSGARKSGTSGPRKTTVADTRGTDLPEDKGPPRLMLAAGFVLLAMAFLALLALGVAYVMTRPNIASLLPNNGTCGEWQVEIAASGMGELQLLANGVPVSAWQVSVEEKTYIATGVAPYQSEVRFEARLGDVVVDANLKTPRSADTIEVTPNVRAFPISDLEVLRASHQTSCGYSGDLQWTAGNQNGGANLGIPGPNGLEIDLTPLPEGSHQVVIEATTTDMGTVGKVVTTILIEPPCDDNDNDGFTVCGGDCDDSRSSVNPGATERPGNGRDEDCDGRDGPDHDGDGYISTDLGGEDCNDNDPNIRPGVMDSHDADNDGYDVKDGIDDDCDGRADDDVSGTMDCDDNNRNVNPGVKEAASPNGIDDNCDGRVDEGTVVYDDDGDGKSEVDGDCNDADASVFPGARELADCRDQDCDNEVDEGLTLPKKDDTWESNDSGDDAADLGTSTKRSFSKDLELVTREDGDEEWFQFYSQDGGWDDWGIDVTLKSMGEGHSYRLEIYGPNGDRRAEKVVRADGEAVKVRGRAFHNDGGNYRLAVKPVKMVRPWCPLTVHLVSR